MMSAFHPVMPSVMFVVMAYITTPTRFAYLSVLISFVLSILIRKSRTR
ncbi:MAG: hypothetical protein WBV94_10250 [Blastocatellia bacterium]